MGRAIIDLTGKRFGRWLVLEQAKQLKKGIIRWFCECDCGNNTIVNGHDLRNGHSLCCGCLRVEKIIERNKQGHSEETKRKMRGKRVSISGENHPQWNPNITDEDRVDKRKYPEYQDWRKAVYERDDYICQVCSNIRGNLNAHHLESYTSNKELRTTLSNGVTLCETCHKDFHHQYGYGDNTKEQFEEYKGEKNG